MDYLIAPDFNALNGSLAIPATSLNYFVKAELTSTFGLYQERYNVYGYMTLNKAMKYVINTVSGTPLMWQPHRTCGWTPTGSLMIGKREFEPCKVKINEEFCYDELFESCFEHLLSWDGSGPLELDDTGVAVMNLLIQTLAENSQLGARVALVAGQKYNPIVSESGTTKFDQNTPANIKDIFNKTIGACKGVLELLEEMGDLAQYEHLNHKDIFQAEDFFNGKTYKGDVLALYDALFEGAKPELKSFIDQGGTPGLAGRTGLWPLFLVSDSILSSVASAYREQTSSFPAIGFTPRLGMEIIPNVNGGRSWKVYTIDNVPVIPVSEISHYDKFLTGATHFACITISENIQMGTSFATLPTTRASEGAAMLVEQSTAAKDYGMFYFLAHALLAVTFANTDMISATQVYAEPKPVLV